MAGRSGPCAAGGPHCTISLMVCEEGKWNEEGNQPTRRRNWCDFSVKRHFISLRLGGKQCANRPRGASLTRRRASAGVIGCCLRAGRCQSLMIKTAPKASYVSQTCLLWLTEAQHGHWLILIFSLEIVTDSWKQSQPPNTAGTNDVKPRSRSTPAPARTVQIRERIRRAWNYLNIILE